jgi:TolB-like protein/DNA-binding winged helix-turn-helix (wHTH) protein
MTEPAYEFGGFLVDSTRRLLFGPGGEPLALTSRAFDTLLFMCQHPGELLEKAVLMEAVWPNAVVEENNLNQAIFTLRRALKETPGEHRFIVTVPGRGYRFVAPVRQRLPALETPDAPHRERMAGPVPEPPWVVPAPPPVAVAEPVVALPATPTSAAPAFTTPALADAPAPEPTVEIALPDPPPAAIPARRRHTLWFASLLVAVVALVVGSLAQRADTGTATAMPAATGAASVAVLPFADLSETQDQQYFSEGLAEEVISQLGQMPGLRVVGRTSSFSFRGSAADLRRVGRSLGVNHILEGSVRKARNRVRVTTQLVHAASGTRLWSATYDRDLDDVFSVQEEIAGAVAKALSVQLSAGASEAARVGTRNIEAYDAYLAANTLLNRMGPGIRKPRSGNWSVPCSWIPGSHARGRRWPAPMRPSTTSSARRTKRASTRPRAARRRRPRRCARSSSRPIHRTC